MYYLDWPEELLQGAGSIHSWSHPGSNICLDFHGNPSDAQLVIFSDGNHHMALKDCLDLFLSQNKDVTSIFYATTPPGPLVSLLKAGKLKMGNLIFSVTPHIFISPPDVLSNIVASGHIAEHFSFVRNQGNVLLVKKDNPKRITSVHDLTRDDVRLFLSNPETEKVSYSAYYETLCSITSMQDTASTFPNDKISKGQVVFGKRIHHREAPQAVADGRADAAIVFYHLALRYIRIFPDLFEMVCLGGCIERPEPGPGNVISKTHIALIGDGGKWGSKLLAFLGSKKAMDLYRYHGLLPLSESHD